MLKCMCEIVCVKHYKVSCGISFSILGSLDPVIWSSWAPPHGSHILPSATAATCLRLEHKPKSTFSFSFPCLSQWNHQLLEEGEKYLHFLPPFLQTFPLRDALSSLYFSACLTWDPVLCWLVIPMSTLSFPGGSDCKDSPAVQSPWVRKIPWRRNRLHTPIFLPGELHGLLAGYRPWGHRVWHNWTSTFTFFSLSNNNNKEYLVINPSAFQKATRWSS